VLIVNRKFRVANDVDEENMRDLELDLFLDLVGRLFLSTSHGGFCPSCSPHSNDKMIYADTMTRATLTIAAVAFLWVAAADVPPVMFVSPCDCRDNHGKHRWLVKIDPSPGDGCKRD